MGLVERPDSFSMAERSRDFPDFWFCVHNSTNKMVRCLPGKFSKPFDALYSSPEAPYS